MPMFTICKCVRHRQEFELLGNLASVGCYSVDELESTLDRLFPAKSAKEKTALVAKICEHYKPSTLDVKSKLAKTQVKKEELKNE